GLYMPPVPGLRTTFGHWPSWFLLVLRNFSLCLYRSPKDPRPVSCRMSQTYWQSSELYKHVEAQARQPRTTANDGQSTSQPQQNYLPSAPVTSYEDPTPADTQHQVMYSGDPASNDQVLAPAGLHDAGLSQSDIPGPLPSTAGQPLHDGSPIQNKCLWTTTPQSQCSFRADTIQSMLTHISLQHLPRNQLSSSKVKCHICSPPKTIRRDTIRRHIREIHYGDKSRCRCSS
ncbi:hypothetical protein EDB19DRAFT_1692440, partial [Suillus lakei]